MPREGGGEGARLHLIVGTADVRRGEAGGGVAGCAPKRAAKGSRLQPRELVCHRARGASADGGGARGGAFGGGGGAGGHPGGDAERARQPRARGALAFVGDEPRGAVVEGAEDVRHAREALAARVWLGHGGSAHALDSGGLEHARESLHTSREEGGARHVGRAVASIARPGRARQRRAHRVDGQRERRRPAVEEVPALHVPSHHGVGEQGDDQLGRARHRAVHEAALVAPSLVTRERRGHGERVHAVRAAHVLLQSRRVRRRALDEQHGGRLSRRGPAVALAGRAQPREARVPRRDPRRGCAARGVQTCGRRRQRGWAKPRIRRVADG